MKEDGKIILLTENLVEGKTELLGENGLSIYLEAEECGYLFDAGFGKALDHNAALLHIELKNIKGLILSHSHPDHTEGIKEILKYHSSLNLHAHPLLFNYRYREEKNRGKVYGGIPYTRSYLERKGANFIFNTKGTELEDWLYLSGQIDRSNSFEKSDLEGRFIEIEGQVITDTIPEEQALILGAEEGLIIITGCAHSGLINTIDHAIKTTGRDSIYCVIGGTHLAYAEQEQVEETLDRLEQYKIQRIITGHCTGINAAARLRNRFGERFEFSWVGKEIRFTSAKLF